jgi:hypothetical protein
MTSRRVWPWAGSRPGCTGAPCSQAATEPGPSDSAAADHCQLTGPGTSSNCSINPVFRAGGGMRRTGLMVTWTCRATDDRTPSALGGVLLLPRAEPHPAMVLGHGTGAPRPPGRPASAGRWPAGGRSGRHRLHPCPEGRGRGQRPRRPGWCLLRRRSAKQIRQPLVCVGVITPHRVAAHRTSPARPRPPGIDHCGTSAQEDSKRRQRSLLG